MSRQSGRNHSATIQIMMLTDCAVIRCATSGDVLTCAPSGVGPRCRTIDGCPC
ncbi:hypothetical protein [Propioniferax innocua]|uniref:Uncharacterized protein n=1 Tax=Propioniferax innocua TaxID=1753 RepID=A0A542ZPS6_9ACTN|nr:hypothetical protein FB460_0138 [Propioniferax innocua]